MKKKIFRGILILLLFAVLLFVGYFYTQTRPSGDINKYKEFFVDDTSSPSDSSVKVTFFGVSTLLIDDGQTQLLIDGFFTRPRMLRTLTSDIQSDTVLIRDRINQYKMNRVKGVFVTHSHYDHALDAGYDARMMNATLFGSMSTLNIGRGAGVAEDHLQLFEPNKDYTLGDFIVRVIPSKHSPGNTLNDEGVQITEPKHQPASFKSYPADGTYDFLVSHHGKKIYIKPSPNFIAGALDSLRADVLFIGIPTITKNGLDFRDQFYKENITTLHPSIVIPIHWDNFFDPLSDDMDLLPKSTCNAEEDFDYVIHRAKEDNISFKVLQGTKSIVLVK